MAIDINSSDFERLVIRSSPWGSWAEGEADRWEHTVPDSTELPSWNWVRAYWTERNWGHVIMCRTFLESLNEPYEVIYDRSGGEQVGPGVWAGEYVILTNYNQD